VEAFEFYYRLTEGDKIATRGDIGQLTSGGNARRVGMQFSYIGTQGRMDPGIWGFGAVPLGPTGLRGAEINATMLGIFAGVKDPKVRDAAWRYIEFMGSDVANKIRTDTLVEMGQVNQINPVTLRKFGYTSFLGLSEPGLEEEFMLAMETAKPEPFGKNCNLVYIEMTYPLDQILLSGKIANLWKGGKREEVRAEIKRILDDAVSITNERMLGMITPQEMKTRRIAAWIAVAGIIAAFVYVGRMIFKTFSEVGQATSRVRGVQKYYAWGLLAIPIGLTLSWNYLPVIRGAGMALLDYQLLLESSFVGIDNFANVLYDLRFWKSLLATVHFAFWLLTLGFFAPILLAYLLHIAPKQKLLFRTLYYLPSLLSGAALYVLWKQFFSRNGMVNELLALVGINVQRAWPDDPVLAMLSCVIPTVWAASGPGCLIYLAALKTIPEEQFEAAEIDGASFLSKTVHIVFPGLKPLIIINFVGAVAGAFHSSQNILIMTGGGPNGATEVASLRLFYEAFMFLNFGPATAMAWILGAMLIGFTLIQLRRLSRMEFKGTSS
jgi:ABC-type sugar transport system permease subunit